MVLPFFYRVCELIETVLRSKKLADLVGFWKSLHEIVRLQLAKVSVIDTTVTKI